MTEQTLFRLRVRYAKRGRLRYLGHLEVLHTIERIVRRARLPYAVTQGFSPHMRAGFSAALPVGTASTCEWYDIFLVELVPTHEALERLRIASPRDLAPIEAGYVDVRAEALTAFITCASYRIVLHMAPRAMEPRVVRRALDAVCSRPSIAYLRGKKEKALDLTRTLAGYDLEELGAGAFALILDTRMSNDGALRPEVLVGALNNELADAPEAPIHSTGIQNLELIPRYEVTRTAQYGLDEAGAPAYPLPARR